MFKKISTKPINCCHNISDNISAEKYATPYAISESVQRRLKRCCNHQARAGLNRIEVIILLILGLIIVGLCFPLILSAREMARKSSCSNRLRNLGTALLQYHDTHQFFPPAAIWHPGSFRSMMLNENRRVDLISHENWVMLLLPYLGQLNLAESYDPKFSIGSDENESIRLTWLSEMRCPSDSYHRASNPYRFELNPDSPPQVEFARGNYAINGGTQCHRTVIGTSSRPAGEGVEIIADDESREFRYVGSGIAGINQAFSLRDFSNGQSSLVALEELRSGIHPLDPRGVWALGQIGGSMTSAHGVSGDAGGPNNQWDRADDILGCGRLHDEVGRQTLTDAQMPCAHYIDRNDQATARSMHYQGVHVLFLDGAVRFVNDRVDRGLWHVMHSRETPSHLLENNFEERLNKLDPTSELATVPSSTSSQLKPGETFKNSLEMSFVVLPAGEFQMGIPDIGNGGPAPPESPEHTVRITKPIWMGQYEVTQKAYATVMGTNPSYHQDIPENADDLNEFPVEQMTWFEAEEFCKKLTEQPEEKRAGRQYRLPTEAEWEYACRAGQSKPYDWPAARGGRFQSGENAGLEPPLPIKKVGSYPPNEFGLHDMRGNVWEWCSDWFDRHYYSRSPAENPAGPNSGYLKVLRGSDWIYVGEVCRINYPILPPWKSNRFVGFRVVCEPIP